MCQGSPDHGLYWSVSCRVRLTMVFVEQSGVRAHLTMVFVEQSAVRVHLTMVFVGQSKLASAKHGQSRR